MNEKLEEMLRGVDLETIQESDYREILEKLFYDLALQVLETEANARYWLGTPKKIFRGLTPIQYALRYRQHGVYDVVRAFGSIEHGIYY